MVLDFKNRNINMYFLSQKKTMQVLQYLIILYIHWYATST